MESTWTSLSGVLRRRSKLVYPNLESIALWLLATMYVGSLLTPVQIYVHLLMIQIIWKSPCYLTTLLTSSTTES